MTDNFLDHKDPETQREPTGPERLAEVLTKLATADPSKALAVALGTVVHELMDEGLVTASEVAVRLKFFDTFIGAVKGEELTELVREEVMQHGREHVVKGARLELAEAGVRYDYSKDYTWDEIFEQENDLATQRKEREKMLRSLTTPIEEVVKDTGEVRTVNPPVKFSTSTFKVTLKP